MFAAGLSLALSLLATQTAAAAADRTAAPDASATVRLWQDKLILPTYPVGPAEKLPLFYHGRKYQGAKGPVYPYAMLDKLGEVRQDQAYQAIHLENRYVAFTILPEIGGRIFSGVDKTNGYDFLYRQHVIKPSLIGMAGAWISGGVEWNIPHHHRVSTYLPVDYRLLTNADGSKTVWLGELELRDRMKWLVGLTLYPNRSYLEVTVKLFNRTPLRHSMLYFANVAVHANPDYQILFPPRTLFGVQHAKREFIQWPVAQGEYGGLDQSGVDVSWWKNHRKPISIFAWNDTDDFCGGYDHGKQAGLLLVSDHYRAPGKKFFTWGNNDEARMWDRLLTDTDGPYIELMAGGYSDNQPDYSWVQPYETRVLKQYWYPIRELGGATAATAEAALHLQSRGGRLKVTANTTAAWSEARLAVRRGRQPLFDRAVAIDPGRPAAIEIPLPPGTRPEELSVVLATPDGRELVRHQGFAVTEAPVPPAVVPPSPPREVKTTEELYLTGLRGEQFQDPAVDPVAYYEEALRRDPGDTRSNLALGVLALKSARYQQSQRLLSAALGRLTANYTRPRQGEADYYHALALRALGKLSEAEAAFERSAWDQSFRAAACYQLAELACRHSRWQTALEKLDESLQTNRLNQKAACLKAAVFRRLGRPDEAADAAAQAAQLDPLDFWAAEEACRATSPSNRSRCRADLAARRRDNAASYLELATDYANCGLWDEAVEVLLTWTGTSKTSRRTDPMVYYTLGWLEHQRGNESQAASHAAHAREMSTDYCFPFRVESIDVLRYALQLQPADARAAYYLGCLLYDLQPEEALAAWERSRALDPSFAPVHRNLAIAYAKVQRNPGKAVASLEKAIDRDAQEPRFFAEIDPLAREAGIAPAKRLEWFEKHHAVVAGNQDALLREIHLLVLVGRYDRAIELFGSRRFRRWEGDTATHDLFVDAHLLRGQQRLKADRATQALADFQTAATYPEHLEVGRPFQGGTRDAAMNYFTGLAYRALKQDKEAKAAFRRCTQSARAAGEGLYYQALAYRELGEDQAADARLGQLERSGNELLTTPPTLDFTLSFGLPQPPAFRKSQGHYHLGMAALGRGKLADAATQFAAAKRLDVDLVILPH